jgi:hypothetical protein
MKNIDAHITQDLSSLSGHSVLVRVKRPNKVFQSCNVDEAFKSSDPNGNRWDYWIRYGTNKSKKVVWLEVHSAQSTSTINKVIDKASWLYEKMKGPLKTLAGEPGTLYWIPTGSVGILRDSNARRRLAKHGIVLSSKPLELS